MAWYEAFTKPIDVVGKVAVITEDAIKERVTTAWQGITDRLFYDLKCQRRGEAIVFDNVRLPLDETQQLVSGAEYETYTVQVTPKQPVRVGELEFEAWREDRYTVVITQNDTPITNEALRQRIVQQLRHFPHFLTDSQLGCNQSTTDIEEAARHWYTLWLIEHDKIYRVNQTRGLLPPHYTREDLRHNVMGLAIEKNDPSIIENYYGKVNYALEVQKQLLIEKQNVLQKMIAEADEAKRAARKQFWKTVGWVVLALVIVAAVLVGLYFLSPIVFGMAIGVLGLGNILAFFKGAALGILEVLKAMPFLNILFLGLLAITAVGVYRSYNRHKENLAVIKEKETQEEIRTIEKAQNGLALERSIIMSKVTGVRDKIANLEETAGVLNLSSYEIGSPEVSGIIGIVREHASEIKEINLSSNRIDAVALKKLVEMLKTQSALHSLNLKGNMIQKFEGKPNNQGIIALRTMLKSNFTVTTLQYDAECFAENQPIRDEIMEQVNINRYLHGEELIGERVNEEAFRLKVLRKLNSNFYITSISGGIREDLQGEVARIFERNRIFLDLEKPRSTTTLPKFIEVYRTSQSACDLFLRSEGGRYSEAVRGRLAKLLTRSENSKEAIFALHSLDRKVLQAFMLSVHEVEINDQKAELLHGIFQVQKHFPPRGIGSLSNRAYRSLLETLQLETLAYLKGEREFSVFLNKTVALRLQLEKLQDLGEERGQRNKILKALDQAIQKPIEIDIFTRFSWIKSSDAVQIDKQAALFEALSAYPHLFTFDLGQVRNGEAKHTIESVLQANKLKDIFQRGGETLQIGDFIEFLECYKTIRPAQCRYQLSALRGAKNLPEWVQGLLSRFPEAHLYHELAKVEKEARTELLTECFPGEGDCLKGRLVSEMLELPIVYSSDRSREATELRACLKHAFCSVSGYRIMLGLFGGEPRWNAEKIADELGKIRGRLEESNELRGKLDGILEKYNREFRSEVRVGLD